MHHSHTGVYTHDPPRPQNIDVSRTHPLPCLQPHACMPSSELTAPHPHNTLHTSASVHTLARSLHDRRHLYTCVYDTETDRKTESGLSRPAAAAVAGYACQTAKPSLPIPGLELNRPCTLPSEAEAEADSSFLGGCSPHTCPAWAAGGWGLAAPGDEREWQGEGYGAAAYLLGQHSRVLALT